MIVDGKQKLHLLKKERKKKWKRKEKKEKYYTDTET